MRHSTEPKVRIGVSNLNAGLVERLIGFAA